MCFGGSALVFRGQSGAVGETSAQSVGRPRAVRGSEPSKRGWGHRIHDRVELSFITVSVEVAAWGQRLPSLIVEAQSAKPLSPCAIADDRRRKAGAQRAALPQAGSPGALAQLSPGRQT